jgi:hypothetical protein
MTTPHTPGPWLVKGLKVYVEDEDPERGMDYPVAWVQGTSPNCPETSANARLIAQAPALLGLLERTHTAWINALELDLLLPQHRATARELADEIHAGIAKARGQA